MTVKELRERLSAMSDEALIVVDLQEGNGVDAIGIVAEVRVVENGNKRSYMDGEFQLMKKSGRSAVLIRPTSFGELLDCEFEDSEESE